MELRPYQQHAFNAIMTAMQTDRYILCQAATGAGKTILFSAIIRHCMEHFKMRIGILAHREILVRQAQDKLLKVWPEGGDRIGLACSSVSHDVQLWRPVIIGSPQTLANRLDAMPSLNMVIIDEAHRLPPRNEKSQYQKLLFAMEERYPKLRVIGFTATPYRLGHGYVFGEQCRPGKENWFGDLHCQVSIAELQSGGYLVPCAPARRKTCGLNWTEFPPPAASSSRTTFPTSWSAKCTCRVPCMPMRSTAKAAPTSSPSA